MIDFYPVRRNLLWGRRAIACGAWLFAAIGTARAAGPNTFDCDPSKYDVVIANGASVRVPKPTTQSGVTTFTPHGPGAVLGLDDILGVASGVVRIDDSSGAKGILINPDVTINAPSLSGLRFKSSGEVVLAGAVWLGPTQKLSIDAAGLEAIACFPSTANGWHIYGGALAMKIGASGIGASSSPKGQVTTLLVNSLSLRTAPGARVCLDMQRGGDTGTLVLGAMTLGGQTGIRLYSGPVYSTGGIAMLPNSNASLLIGPNATLCY